MFDKITILLLLSLGVASCSTEKAPEARTVAPSQNNNQNQAPIQTPTTPPAVNDGVPTYFAIVSGGRLSCKEYAAVTDNYFAPAVLLQVATLQKKSATPVRYFLTCFGSDSKADELAYVSEKTPNSVTKINRSGILQLILGEITKSTNPVIYLTGHSYGGWLAMQLATMIPANMKLRMLATVDPISPMSCGVSNYLKAIGGVLSGNFEIPGCNIAPQDITSAQRAAIRQRLDSLRGTWFNYYQNQFKFLHSSAISEAHANQVRTPSPFNFFGNEHNEIGMEENTRTLINNLIVNDLQSI